MDRSGEDRKMLIIDPPASRYLWNTENGYIALPSKKNCRWIIPMNPKLAKKAWDLYRPYSLQGRLYKTLIKSSLYSNRSNSRNVIKQNNYSAELAENLKKLLVSSLKRDDITLAVSTGTRSPFRKITGIVLSSEAAPLAYVKIGETDLVKKRVKHEADILKRLEGKGLTVKGKKDDSERLKPKAEIIIPECLYDGELGDTYIMVQSASPFEGKSGGTDFDEKYAKVLNELMRETVATKKFNNSGFYVNLKKEIVSYPLSYRDLLSGSLEYLEKELEGKEVTFAISHGDFAPWNMIWNGEKVFIYDWESAVEEAPAGIDLVHFLFQTGFLLKKLRRGKLLNYIRVALSAQLVKAALGHYMADPNALITTYLLLMAVSEDKEDILSPAAVERRTHMRILLGRR